MMQYVNMRVFEQFIGIPTEDERKELIRRGYTLIEKDYKGNETWHKNARFLRGGVTITDYKPWIFEEVPVDLNETDIINEDNVT